MAAVVSDVVGENEGDPLVEPDVSPGEWSRVVRVRQHF